MSAEVKVTGQNQEQFLLLAKSAKGAALATLIHQVLEAPGVYVFGELLDMPNVREVRGWPGSPPRGGKLGGQRLDVSMGERGSVHHPAALLLCGNDWQLALVK